MNHTNITLKEKMFYTKHNKTEFEIIPEKEYTNILEKYQNSG